MPKHIASRRAVLAGAAGIAATGAIAALPVPAARANHATPIQMLWEEYSTFLPEYERLNREQDLAHERWLAETPPVPDELSLESLEIYDYRLNRYRRDYRRAGRGIDRSGFTWITAEGWRHAANDATIDADFRLRAQQVLPIAEQYEATCEAVDRSSGLTTANAAYEAAMDRVRDIWEEILATRPETISDLAIQADTAELERPDDDCEALIAAIRALAEKIKENGGVHG